MTVGVALLLAAVFVATFLGAVGVLRVLLAVLGEREWGEKDR